MVETQFPAFINGLKHISISYSSIFLAKNTCFVRVFQKKIKFAPPWEEQRIINM